jgi:hypothetical protein
MYSGATLNSASPKGIPISDNSIKRQADLISTLRQFFMSIVIAMVEAANATSGVAVCIPRAIASSGMAIKASPNPTAERMKVDMNIMIIARRTGVVKFIAKSLRLILYYVA